MLKFVSIPLVTVCLAIQVPVLNAADPPDPLAKMGLTKRMGIGRALFVTQKYDGKLGWISVLGERTDTFPGYTPQFTADGKGIVYARENPKRGINLYFRDMANGKTTKINIGKRDGYVPSLSPDGSQLAFSIWHGEPDRHDIFIRRSAPYSFEDSVECQQLTTKYNNWHPRWSPDGTQILFCSKRTGRRQIYIMDQDGNNQTSLTDDNVFCSNPAWSFDGNEIAYEVIEDISNDRARGDIFVMKSDGSQKRKISPGTTDDKSPAWTPHGQWIAFSRLNTETGMGDLWIMRRDGTEPRQITRNGKQTFTYDLMFTE